MAYTSRQYISIAERMKSDRSTYDATCQRLRNNLRPDGDSFTSRDIMGRWGRSEILDNTGELAAELLAAALHGMLTNPASPWMKWTVRDGLKGDREVVLYLAERTRRQLTVLGHPSSAFAPQMHELYLDAVDYGTYGCFVGDRPGRLPLFQSRPLNELMLTQSEEGPVNGVWRWFELSAQQAVERYGNNAGPKTVEKAKSSSLKDSDVTILHALHPTNEPAAGSPATRFPITSAHINVSEQREMELGGYEELPVIAGRWSKRSREPYGRGPGHRALPMVKLLQRGMRSWIRSAEQSIRPPMQVADDGIASRPKMYDGAFNVVAAHLLQRGGDGIKPINTGARPDIGHDYLDALRFMVQEAFFKNLLNLSRDPRMTATQFLEIVEETLRILGPILGRLQTEFLAPMLRRHAAVMERARLMPPMPTILQGEELLLEFVSPIARAQRLVEVRGIAQTVEIMAPWIQLDPSIADIQDGHRTYRHVADLLGQPLDLLRSEDAVEAIRQNREQQEQALRGLQEARETAMAAGQVAPLLQVAQNAQNQNGDAANAA